METLGNDNVVEDLEPVRLEKEKPPVLYHASSRKDLEILKPRAESIRDDSEGPVVFATQDKSFVSCFLVDTDDSWSKISVYRSSRHPNIYLHCIADEQRFKELDKGGAIYSVASDSFSLDESKGDIEWTSKTDTEPFKSEVHESGLDAMLDNGVQVYFCDVEKLNELKEVTDDVQKTMEILKGMKSENERRGLESTIPKYY